MGHEHKYMGHETANWGGRGLGYMFFNVYLCNQQYYWEVVVGPGAHLCPPLRGVGSESRDVDTWTQTSLYVEDRGPPSTDDHGSSPVRLCHTGPDLQTEVSDRHVSDYPIGPH
jgi:hypothetical protein